MAAARQRLEAAHALLEHRLLGAGVSEAYYAVLYAARAALSEREKDAKTHRGTWNLFYDEFVSSNAFDAELARAARATQEPREGVDYAAAQVSLEETERIVDVADRFVAAVTALVDG